ncbi:hypothetical protein DYB38_004344, partial [Aphanomyces astaci]
MLLKMRDASKRELEAMTGIPRSNLSRWGQQADLLMSFDGNKKRFNLEGAGRPVELPCEDGLEILMHKLRDAERAVTCTHLINYLKRHHKEWLA